MVTEVSDSRFYMWRAVFAMAHMDGKITQAEKDFVANYLKNVPFSPAQKQTILNDLDHPQNIGEMLLHVTAKTDEADFFQFAQMMAWKDGIDEQEKALLDRLTSEQMNKFNKQAIAAGIRATREAARVRRDIEDAEFKRQAKTLLGNGALRIVMPWVAAPELQTPADNTYNLWRAVFSLIHADGKVSVEEEEYVRGMMVVFRFTKDQKEKIEEDLKKAPDTEALFALLTTKDSRRQFFVSGYTLLWVDGEFSDSEQMLFKKLMSKLDKTEQADIDTALKDAKDEKKPKGLKGVLNNMIDFVGGTQD